MSIYLPKSWTNELKSQPLHIFGSIIQNRFSQSKARIAQTVRIFFNRSLDFAKLSEDTAILTKRGENQHAKCQCSLETKQVALVSL